MQVIAPADEDLGGDDDEAEECEAAPADEETAGWSMRMSTTPTSGRAVEYGRRPRDVRGRRPPVFAHPPSRLAAGGLRPGQDPTRAAEPGPARRPFTAGALGAQRQPGGLARQHRPHRHPQLLALHADLREIVESNRQDGNKTKPAALVDAHPGLGKSTAVRAYGCDLFKRQVSMRGDTTPDGARRVPVIYIALSGNTQIRGLNAAICRFYGLPVKGDADTLAERAVDAVLSMKTVAMVIDDIHFLAGSTSNSVRMANQLKYLSNVFPVTLIYVGVGVQERGILHEGFSPRRARSRSSGAVPRR
ncbi:TniB family NTP-binding protein [Streptomyces sp. M10(2022)]